MIKINAKEQIKGLQYSIEDVIGYASECNVLPKHVEVAKSFYKYFVKYENDTKAFNEATCYLDKMEQILLKKLVY